VNDSENRNITKNVHCYLYRGLEVSTPDEQPKTACVITSPEFGKSSRAVKKYEEELKNHTRVY